MEFSTRLSGVRTPGVQGQVERLRHSRGVSLIEMMLVVGLISTMCAIAALVMPSMLISARADGALATLLGHIRLARETAVGSRRNIALAFVGTNQIQSVRLEVPGPATTVIGAAEMEGGCRYQLFAGVPDTPDLFGNTNAIEFGPTPQVMFTSEGTLVDANGDPVNGTIFIGQPQDPTTARAVTIFGPTALIRAWRWNGSQWVEAR
jgi:hypothetical protein